jgi:hypothetical protein
VPFLVPLKDINQDNLILTKTITKDAIYHVRNNTKINIFMCKFAKNMLFKKFIPWYQYIILS